MACKVGSWLVNQYIQGFLLANIVEKSINGAMDRLVASAGRCPESVGRGVDLCHKFYGGTMNGKGKVLLL